jgi:histidine triad (HIT) family protein
MDKSACLFCKIINKEIPSQIRFEDDNWLAFDDIHKSAPEHVLIVPKTHYKTLEEVEMNDDQFYSQLIITARKIARQLGIENNYKLFMNVGEKVQIIHHLHLHLMGGWPTKATTEELDQESNQLLN